MTEIIAWNKLKTQKPQYRLLNQFLEKPDKTMNASQMYMGNIIDP